MATTVKHYVEGIGRRKEAVARVRIAETAKTSFLINEKPSETYFKTSSQREACVLPLSHAGATKVAITAHVKGGGLAAQAVAISLGLARALELHEKTLRAPLKKAGLLSRDAREKERRKFGLKKARKRGKWSKR